MRISIECISRIRIAICPHITFYFYWSCRWYFFDTGKILNSQILPFNKNRINTGSVGNPLSIFGESEFDSAFHETT